MVNNLTNLTTSTNFVEMLHFGNEVTRDLFSASFFLAFWFIIMMGLKESYSFLDSMVASSFVMSLASIFLVNSYLLSPTWSFLSIIILCASILLKMLGKE